MIRANSLQAAGPGICRTLRNCKTDYPGENVLYSEVGVLYTEARASEITSVVKIGTKYCSVLR